ncbi:WXG100 family type VII secretion target [Amycolatopsis nigrescens]|uniref:WXG100 family type VII secretion target n=1 Tax=Amycolatopsis nigrescens TaxID=381445 RepID=UPI00039E750E|nr:WXG100 family type VII secretion target [Amycolatopsis nigrescens]
MGTKWSDVKAVLDDPSVPPGAKTVLISSWMKTHPAPPPFMSDQEPEDIKKLRKEAEKYADSYNANPFVATDDVDGAYKAAKGAGDQASYNRREESKAVDKGNEKLDSAKAPGADGGGTEKSDELFDAAVPALKVFETFGSLLAKLPDDCRGTTRALDFEKDIKKPFDQQRGIIFRDFVDDAAHFKTGSTTVERTMKDTESQLNTLRQSWSGDGADAASDEYNEQILPKAKKLAETLNNAGETTLKTTTTVFELCKGKADAVIELHTDLVGRADFAMAQKVVAIASGEKSGVEDLAEIAGWMDVNFGSNLVETLNSQDGCCDDDEYKKAGQNLAKQWVQNQFNPDMWDRIYQGFVKTCEDTKELVDQAYDELDKVMGKVKNEFEGADKPPGDDKGGSGTGGSGGPGGGKGGAGGPDIPDINADGPGNGGGGQGDGSGGPGGGGSGTDGEGIPDVNSDGTGEGQGGPGDGKGGPGGGPEIPGGGSGAPGGGPGGPADGKGADGKGGGGGPVPPVPDVSSPSGGGPGGGSGPDSSKGDTAPSGSAPPPSSGDQEAAAEAAKKQEAAAAAEEAKKKAAEALGKSGGGSGPGGESLGGGSGPGGSPGGGSGPGGGTGSEGGDGKAAAEKAAEDAKKQEAAAAAEEAKKKASEALGKIGGELPGQDGDKPAGDKPGEGGDKPGQDNDKQGSDHKPGEDGKDGDSKDDEREVLKVKQGDKSFEMSEPDQDGKMDIKVGDGSGPAKEFKLDWPEDGEKPGADDGKPGEDGVHRPGPDGKIHVQDGDLKITAERPDGPNGPTVVTVDDGTGKPTTYTLGEEDSDGDKKSDGDKGSHEDKPSPASRPSGTEHQEPRPALTPHLTESDSGGNGGGGHGGGGGGPAVAAPFGDATAMPSDTPASLADGAHSGTGAHQPQPASSAFAPAATTAGGAPGQPVGGGAMPPMGGMGGGGGGANGGGDQERTNRAYRIEGEVFDQVNAPTGRITGSLLDDEELPVTRKR